MKISNETKIGALAAISITLLILGFNFLKGKSLFNHTKKIYAIFKSVEGMEVSNSVLINGLSIGNVSDIHETDKDISGILVVITLKKDIHIPKNSIAFISPGLITSTAIIVNKGDATDYLQDGDTITTKEKPGLISQVQDNIDPIVAKLGGTLESLDSLVEVVGTLFDPKTKNNFSSIFAHIAASSATLEIFLHSQSGILAHSLKNLDTFTTDLASNKGRIDKTMDNMQNVSGQLANVKIGETVATIQAAVNELKTTLDKVNSNNGSLGLLLNDKKLYQNLESTSRSLNTLLDDFRVHPKRYVNISVFGKKDKNGYLTSPLSDSTSKSGNK
jgi:phospholipid/cholesterol/gamma-HCH transport system substrate-binding protein